MKKLVEQKISGFTDRDSRRVFSDLEFDRCDFVGCALSVTQTPHNRSTVRNVIWNNCSVRGCTIYAARIEDSVINNLKTHNLLRMFGTVFKHVTFKGEIGHFMINQHVSPATLPVHKQAAFDQDRRNYYNSVDWALDISEAKFVECDIRSVPAQLIRRDPETQMILTREKAIAGEWRNLDLSETHWPTVINFFLDSGEESIILGAPKASPNFEKLLKGLMLLRDRNIVY